MVTSPPSRHDGPMDSPTAHPTDAAAPSPERRLHRRTHGRIVAGVAAGLADWLDLDVTLVRLGFVVLGLVGGLAVPLYLAAWLLVPDEGTEHSVAEAWLGLRGEG